MNSPSCKGLTISIHNADKATFDGRDCFIVCLLDEHGNLLFYPKEGRYDSEATSEHTTIEEAITHAGELAKRRGAVRITNHVPHYSVIWRA